jgi:hypothetical protein
MRSSLVLSSPQHFYHSHVVTNSIINITDTNTVGTSIVVTKKIVTSTVIIIIMSLPTLAVGTKIQDGTITAKSREEGSSGGDIGTTTGMSVAKFLAMLGKVPFLSTPLHHISHYWT